jgi:hypothetical protein
VPADYREVETERSLITEKEEGSDTTILKKYILVLDSYIR